MNDNELDDKLKQGKKQAGGFFALSRMDGLRKSLIHGLTRPSKNKSRKRKPPGLLLASIAACATVFVCIAMFNWPFAGQNLDFRDNPPASAAARELEPVKSGDAVLEQSLPLGSGEHSVSFHELTSPRTDEPSLLSVLWEDRDGAFEMMGSDVFEKSDTPYPASIIAYPGNTMSKLILLSSGSSSDSYIHYRLIEYRTGSLKTLWAQDYVPHGKLGVLDGVVIEQRSQDSNGLAVSYIIPYIVESGCVNLPVETLSVYVGDTILFIGEDSSPLNANPLNGIARSLDGASEDGQIQAFEAGRAGDEVLLLNSENENGSELSLTVVDR